ncbi:MAG TPA: hypothetical protein VE994_10170 [Terriglobales bacterium]|nr:hypothetical protein [Terriglobales bacterium]
MTPVAAKEKKTFSLSRESVRYLEEIRQKTHKTASQILEELIAEKKREAEEARISTAIKKYYDSLNDEEIDEERKWGEFSERQITEE